MSCQYCRQSCENDYTLCMHCELRFFHVLYQLAADVQPLHDSLDATLHPGGHAPTRIQTATPPTPLRLDVLDLIDLLDSTAYELLRRLGGTDAHPGTRMRPYEDLASTLRRCASSPQLALLPDAGMYLYQFTRLARQTDVTLDPPEHRREIGPCENCATMLTAGPADQWVTCPVCEREQRVQTVKLRRLERLCFDDSRRGSAAEVARAFTDAGIVVRAATVRKWLERGRLARSPLGVAYCDVYRLVVAGAA
ncbi:hypothetical protein [Bifidobacterium biavatii]|uniref:PhnA protein n=1 Tax=Bifidobacterium biavatii DSM 23969 TaxID=1437608 RepID=A0A086ZYW2_9BIFI|nr:hypothetical protein [Bifidobacterium biavatii]KFI51712.1 hypothetical protein BBIA_0625 [Bifidobacterium biavatii DSM 23969]